MLFDGVAVLSAAQCFISVSGQDRSRSFAHVREEIMVFAGFTAVLVVVVISLYGWGALANRLTRNPVRNQMVIVCVGLAVIVFLGGILNLLRLAYGWALDGLIVGGIALAVVLNRGYRPSLPKKRSEWLYVIVVGLVIAAIMIFTVATQLPPRAFNIHDDFAKYFNYPVRMLATGTVFGSPLSAIGLETLGGEAVLHAIVISHFPIAYINGVDAVFGLLLCLILPVSMVPRRMAFLPISLAGMLVVFCINPQYVNISALYLASACMMATILLLSRNDNPGSEDRYYLPPPILLGLLYAALFSLKSNLPVFAAMQGVLFCIAMGLSGMQIRRLGRWSALTVVYTLLFISPWVLLHLPHYLRRSSVPILNEMPASFQEEISLFSFRPFSYGGSFALYTLIPLAVGLSVVAISLWHSKRHAAPENANVFGIAANGAAVICCYLFFIMLGPRLVDSVANLRYTIPVLIAGASMITTIAVIWAVQGKAVKWNYLFIVALSVLQLFIIAGFSKSTLDRLQQAVQSGNILAFFPNLASSSGRKYIEYASEVLQGGSQNRIVQAQAFVPPGKALIAWVTTPFYLDYRRNMIYDVDISGLGSPWAYIPQGADYVIVEYEGFGVFPVTRYYEYLQDPGRRQSAMIILNFLKTIQGLSQQGDILFDDGSFVVFRARREG